MTETRKVTVRYEKIFDARETTFEEYRKKLETPAYCANGIFYRMKTEITPDALSEDQTALSIEGTLSFKIEDVLSEFVRDGNPLSTMEASREF